LPEAAGSLHFGLVILPGLFDLLLGVLQQKERGDGSRQGRRKSQRHQSSSRGLRIAAPCPAPWGQGTSPPGLHPLFLSLPALITALQPWALAPSFSWLRARAEPVMRVSLQRVPKWVTCSLGDSARGDSPGGRPSAAPSAGCPGGRRRCCSGFAPAKGRDGVTPWGSPPQGGSGSRSPRSPR